MRANTRKISFILLLVGISLTPVPVDAAVFRDALGRKVNIVSFPKRIVSLAPGITETLYALGLDREIAGVTTFCTYPEAARLKPRIGGFTNISVEKILSLNPDLVIGTADGNRQETVDKLESLGIPVYVTNPKTLAEILAVVMQVGVITGKEKVARRLTADLQNRVKHLTALVAAQKKLRVFFQVGGEPLITVGRDTLHNQLINLAGGVNIAGREKTLYPRYSVEEVVAEQPEVILFSSMKYAEDITMVWGHWRKWPNIPAVRDNRLHIIDTDLIDRASPRIVDGLAAMVKAIHPEVINKGKIR
ncbi:MAG: cobalamin-binding protein [Deltaproteobacteria bacterium]|nr:cobalamin-binding protein [Deltaproteobacteria bacterium]